MHRCTHVKGDKIAKPLYVGMTRTGIEARISSPEEDVLLLGH